MYIRKYWAALALAHCVLPLGWAVKLGDAVPDVSLRDCSGAEVRLSAYHQKRHAVVLVEAPGAKLAPAVLDDACRDLAARDTVVLVLAGEAAENRRLLETDPPATLLVDPGGVVRRILPGRALTGPDLAGVVKLWEFGKTVFNRSEERRVGKECRSRGSPRHQ